MYKSYHLFKFPPKYSFHRPMQVEFTKDYKSYRVHHDFPNEALKTKDHV